MHFIKLNYNKSIIYLWGESSSEGYIINCVLQKVEENGPLQNISNTMLPNANARYRDAFHFTAAYKSHNKYPLPTK